MTKDSGEYSDRRNEKRKEKTQKRNFLICKPSNTSKMFKLTLKSVKNAENKTKIKHSNTISTKKLKRSFGRHRNRRKTNTKIWRSMI